MAKVLVVQGAGMNMRGKTDIDVFGPATLEEINSQVRAYATELGFSVEIFHSNIEGEVVNALYDGEECNVEGALINPAGYTPSAELIPVAIKQVSFPVIEVHASNPTSRGVVSVIQPACKGLIYGCGLYSYYLGLLALKNALGT